MRARQLAAILTALVLGSLLAPGAAEATGTLDQQQEDTSGGSSSVGSATSLAQTFTAGSSGGLDQVDLFLDRPSPATTSPLNVEIRSVDESGAPGATVLASATVLAESVPSPGDFVPVGFAAPARVVAGTRYAIVLSTADLDLFAYEWAGSGADVYAEGSAWTGDSLLSIWVQDSQDLAFKTYTTAAPTIAIDDATLSEGNSGTTTYTFTVSRSGSLDGTSSVHLETTDDSATVADGDYSATSGDLAFDIGESTKTFDVTVNADTKFEPDEDFKVELSDAGNATISDGEGIGAITNDDAQPTVSIGDVAKSEGNSGTTTYGFTVSLSNPSYQQVTVSRQSADGSATAADDYTALPLSTLSFSPGETSQQVTVNVNADTKFEPDEDFKVELSDAGNATISDGEGIGTITNDDAQPTVSIGDVAKSEGNSGTTTYTFTISRSGSLDGTSSVHLETSDDSASVADNDYAAASGDLAFDTGESTKTFAVTVNADTKFEPDEDFKVELSDAENATIADGEGIGTITNDDGRPTITVNDVAKNEGNSGTTAYGFTVSLSNPSYQQVTISGQSANGSATAADDYTALPISILTFSPGDTQKQVAVYAKGDTKFEPNENFFVNLSTAINAAIADGQGKGTITNDDGRPTITVNDVTKNEGNSGTTAYGFTVSLSNPSYQQITVSRQSANGSATTADSDYTALAAATLTFSPTQTQKQVTVNAKGDTKYEPTEYFQLNLSSATNSAIADSQGTGVITNDDAGPPPGYQPPYDPDFIVNRQIPADFPTDPRSAAVVSRFVQNLQSTKVVVSVHGEVPAVNVAAATDPARTVTIGPVNTMFRIPAGLKVGSGSDHPVEILDPNPSPVDGKPFKELRVWQASWDGTTLRGSNASLSHYNNDNAILNPDGSQSLSYPYVGAATGSGMPYLSGLVRPQEVQQGRIDHTLRFAYSSQDTLSTYRFPAIRSDQNGSGSGAAEMGTIFQLDSSVDCSARTAPGQLYDSLESRFVRIFCVALQRYGGMISDGTGNFRSANFYLEGDGTAHWSNVIGSEAGTGNYGWLVRSKDVAYSSAAPPPTRDTDGIPWLRLRAIARPAGYTSW